MCMHNVCIYIYIYTHILSLSLGVSLAGSSGHPSLSPQDASRARLLEGLGGGGAILGSLLIQKGSTAIGAFCCFWLFCLCLYYVLSCLCFLFFNGDRRLGHRGLRGCRR